MFGECKKCNFDAGYFQLNDRLCKSCITSDGKTKKQNNLSRVFKRMPLLSSFILFALLINITAAIAPFLIPEKFAIFMGANDKVFYLAILMILIPIIIALIARFFLAKRRIHIVFTLAILFPIWTLIIVLSQISLSGSSPPIIALLSIIATFRILRLKNREIEVDEPKPLQQ